MPNKQTCQPRPAPQAREARSSQGKSTGVGERKVYGEENKEGGGGRTGPATAMAADCGSLAATSSSLRKAPRAWSNWWYWAVG